MFIHYTSFPNMEQADKKRKHLSEMTNTYGKHNNRVSNWLIISPVDVLPLIETHKNKDISGDTLIPDKFYL